jgi:hypothetical protein
MKKQRFTQIIETWSPVFRKFVLQALATIDPFLSGIGELPMYEGNAIEVAQGSDTAVADFQRVGGLFTIENEILRTTNFPALQAALFAGVLDMGRSKQQTFFMQLSAILDTAGQTRDAGGKPLTWETWFDLWDMLEFAFDEQGNWIPQAIMCPPQLGAKLLPLLAEWDADPEKRQQFQELFQRKREAFYAKEACRELAD